MYWRKLISSLCAVSLLTVAISGCGSESQVKKNSFDTKTQSTVVEDTFIAQNDNYTLSINETSMGVTLKDLKTGEVYGSNPADTGEVQLDEFGMPIKRHPQVESVLFLEYLDVKTNTTSKLISYTAAVNSGRTVYEKTENGIKINYYFEDAQIMIPLTYTLREDGVAVSLNPKEIQENENMLISVSVAPFWCSVKNTEKDGYILYPSGSGALIYPKEISQPGETYSDEVYGTDASKEVWDKVSTEKSIKLPVFGAKFGKQASFAIIEQGAESSLIDMTVGSTSVGYSSAYVTYQLRGYTANIKELYNNRYYKGLVYADDMITAPLTIGFYPLSGKNATYSNMASVYRNYINKTAGEAKADNISKLDVTVVGGTMISKSFLGIPYKTLYPTTTFLQVKDILADLKKSGVEVSNLNFYGFGENGIDSNKLGGDFAIDSKLGKIKDFTEIKKQNENTNLFFDFDLVKFNDSANGFSSYFDAATRANKKVAKVYNFDIAVLGRDAEKSYSVLARDCVEEAVEKVNVKTKKWNIDGVGFSTLSSIAYSDYSNKQSSELYSKAGIASQVGKALESIENKKIMSSEANAYAAVKSDLVMNIPTVSTRATLFDEDIPFYAMVLRGRTAISCESSNLVSDSRTQLLRAVESGAGLSYTLTSDYSTEILESTTPVFYNSLYTDLKETIVSDYKMLSDYYSLISDSSVAQHIIHKSGLRETVFSNGVRVFVNYSDKAIKTKVGNVPAESFFVLEANT